MGEIGIASCGKATVEIDVIDQFKRVGGVVSGAVGTGGDPDCGVGAGIGAFEGGAKFGIGIVPTGSGERAGSVLVDIDGVVGVPRAQGSVELGEVEGGVGFDGGALGDAAGGFGGEVDGEGEGGFDGVIGGIDGAEVEDVGVGREEVVGVVGVFVGEPDGEVDGEVDVGVVVAIGVDGEGVGDVVVIDGTGGGGGDGEEDIAGFSEGVEEV